MIIFPWKFCLWASKSRTYDQILILFSSEEGPVTIQHLLNNWFYLNSFCKSYEDLTEHTAKICCYGTHFLLYQVLTKKSIFGVPMVELVYFLLTKLFDAYKESYPTKIKFKFDALFFNEYMFIDNWVHKYTITEKNVKIKKKVSNMNFILVGYESLYTSSNFVSKK